MNHLLVPPLSLSPTLSLKVQALLNRLENRQWIPNPKRGKKFISIYIPGMECRRWREFHTHPDWFRSPTRFLLSGYRLCFQVVKRLGCGINYPLPSSTEVKESKAIILLSVSAFMACCRLNCNCIWPLPLPICQQIVLGVQNPSAPALYAWDLYLLYYVRLLVLSSKWKQRDSLPSRFWYPINYLGSDRVLWKGGAVHDQKCSSVHWLRWRTFVVNFNSINKKQSAVNKPGKLCLEVLYPF